ncbi:MAG: GNAT family N-acetyltransferase [Acetobacteraceae bacterium]
MTTRASIAVRALAQADYAQWLVLWSGYNEFYGRSGVTALPDEVTAMTWSRFFDAYEPVHALGAEHEGRLLGIVHYLFHRSTTVVGPVCYLQDLFTSAEARGKGIGASLIRGVYEKAELAKATRVYWQTHETNRIAMALYDKVADKSGFVVYRRPLNVPASKQTT